MDYCDPHFPIAKKTRKHDLRLRSVPVDPDVFARYDAVVVATAHDAFRDAAVYARAKLVIDTRNLIEPLFGGKPPFPLTKA